MADNVTSIPFSGPNFEGWLGGGQSASNASALAHGSAAADYWLPIWSGEVLHAYDQYNIFEPLVTTKTITSGTTLRFPITGTVGIEPVWGAGEELLGSSTNSTPGYFDISLDQRPMASFFELDDISLMLTQWEYRSELARQAGLALANARDKQILSLIHNAVFMSARNPAVAKGGHFHTANHNFQVGLQDYADLSDGASYELPAATAFNHLGGNFNGTSGATDRTNAALKLLEYIEKYFVRLQTMDAPTTGVYVAVSPQAFQDIRSLGIARTAAESVNSQPLFGGVAQAGGLGAPWAQGMNALSDTLTYMGATIVKTNHFLKYGSVASVDVNADWTSALDAGHLPTRFDEVFESIGDQKYNTSLINMRTNGTQSKAFPTKALIWQKDAVASLSLQGLKVDTVKDVRRNTFFTVASAMKGGGILRPELCAAICGVATPD